MIPAEGHVEHRPATGHSQRLLVLHDRPSPENRLLEIAEHMPQGPLTLSQNDMLHASKYS